MCLILIWSHLSGCFQIQIRGKWKTINSIVQCPCFLSFYPMSSVVRSKHTWEHCLKCNRDATVLSLGGLDVELCRQISVSLLAWAREGPAALLTACSFFNATVCIFWPWGQPTYLGWLGSRPGIIYVRTTVETAALSPALGVLMAYMWV